MERSLYGNYILSAGFGVYHTCVNIPYGTLCGAMTQDIDERAKINTSRSVAAMIAIGVLNIITVPLLSKFGSHSAKTGYLTVAAYMDVFLQPVISSALRRRKRQ